MAFQPSGAMDVATPSLWHRALHDPQLQDLPYKIETNERGQLVLSPHTPKHSRLQSRLLRLLDRHVARTGEATIEFAAATPKGVKVPDVVWLSEGRWAQIPDDAEASPVMPELCVEVVSGSNTDDEIAAKRRLYFDEGAAEVWTCDLKGRLRFFDADGERAQSTLAPDMPSSVEAAPEG
jgi:Uma2 family endonuclease